MINMETRFNPRPSVRGDQRVGEVRIGDVGFNPRPSVRGDSKCFLIS